MKRKNFLTPNNGETDHWQAQKGEGLLYGAWGLEDRVDAGRETICEAEKEET